MSTLTAVPDSGLPPASPAGSPAGRSRRQLTDLVLHLARRQLESAHRLTLLGWLWPLVRQLAQLVVLVFLFSQVLDLGIENFGLFVFSGLLAWSWFATALGAATGVLVGQRHLIFSPGFPAIALPLVAVAVPLVDALMVLPVLLVLLAAEGELHATALLLPLLLVVQFALTAGIGLATAAANVYFRDVENVVAVGLLLLFYLTPVFYGLKNVPEQFRWVMDLNPLAALVSAYRALLLDGRLPAWEHLAFLLPAAAVALAAGTLLFRRLEPGFVDEL